jgi:hypothetical protein
MSFGKDMFFKWSGKSHILTMSPGKFCLNKIVSISKRTRWKQKYGRFVIHLYMGYTKTSPRSLELTCQNQPSIQQCFSLTTNQHQHQHQPFSSAFTASRTGWLLPMKQDYKSDKISLVNTSSTWQKFQALSLLLINLHPSLPKMFITVLSEIWHRLTVWLTPGSFGSIEMVQNQSVPRE